MLNQNVAPEERGKLMLKWRTTLGWSVAETAQKVGVSTRTISAVESGAQIMPDARWRLFVHEILAEIDPSPQLVVVLNEQQAPIDVISSDSYAGYALGDDGETALIASHSINRQTGKPELYRTRFLTQVNPHVVQAIQRWEASRQDTTQERAAFEMHRWLMRRVLEGELRKPELIELKAAVLDAKAKVDGLSEAPPEVLAKHMRLFDLAIADLMEAVAKEIKK